MVVVTYLWTGYLQDVIVDRNDCYVPTNLGKEMDFLLMYANPLSEEQMVSYDIIEVKRDKFDEEALSQLISYESWFLQKKVSGYSNMVRTTAIAKSYADNVKKYVFQRKNIEKKPIKLLQYSYYNDFIVNILNIQLRYYLSYCLSCIMMGQ